MSRLAVPVLVGLLAVVAVTGCAVATSKPALETEGLGRDETAEAPSARWSTLPVHYCLAHSEGGFVSDEVLARLLVRAFEEWGVSASYDGECRDSAKEGNGRNEVQWSSLGPADGATRQAGQTQLRHIECAPCSSPESFIIEADVSIDPNPPPARRNQACLFTTLLHEVGHVLGVPHLPPPAVMAPVLTSCPQELTDADLRALADLYE